ncbi:ABC transporter substrate-binding protein [Sulfoacidibacillus thermotolerans]|nr:ABC transporter substrate-binding protein [Sulfoacidibacillus thermotolerans]
MKKIVKYAAMVLAMGISVTSLTACASNTNSATSTPSSRVNASQLVIGVDNGSPTFTDNFNPFGPGNRIGTSYIYEPLFFINTINGQVVPWLATAYKWEGNEKLVFTIRSGVKWNDGQPFSAKDVAFTFNYMKLHPSLDWQGLWQVLQSVTANGNKVTFIFKQPDVPAFYEISTSIIIPQHIWAAIVHPTKGMNMNPVGTGPYEVASFTPYQYTLKKNPYYWQASNVHVEKIVFPVLGNNQTAALKLSSGQWDWATLFLPNVQQTYVSKDPQYNQYWFPPGGIIALELNLGKAPFRDVHFREALAYAIDKQKIAQQAEDGYVSAASQVGLVLPGQQQWLNPALPNQGAYGYNVQMAKQILTQAGYHTNTQGDLLDPSGKPVSFSLEVPSGWTDWIQAAQIIQEDLKQLGIQVNVSTPQYGAYSQSQAMGQYDAALMAYGGTPTPFTSYDSLLDSKYTAPVGQNANANQERWHDAKTDQLLNNWRQATSQQTQLQDAYQIESIMYKQLPVIDLFYGATWSEFSSKKFIGWPSASNPYAPPAPYGQAPLMIMTHLQPRS